VSFGGAEFSAGNVSFGGAVLSGAEVSFAGAKFGVPTRLPVAARACAEGGNTALASLHVRDARRAVGVRIGRSASTRCVLMVAALPGLVFEGPGDGLQRAGAGLGLIMAARAALSVVSRLSTTTSLVAGRQATRLSI
jgi:hypothetical protein